MDKIIDIFQFTNFRKYLDEYQAARVLTDPDFTRAGACVLLGLPKTRSYYNDIVKGKKLSSRMIPKFVEVLGLNKKEARYFETLVNLDQAKTATERNAFFEELLKQHPDSHRILNEDAYEYYNHWYNSVLFTALEVVDVSDDLEPVQKLIFPKVSVGTLKRSLELLERLGFVRKNEDGFWKSCRESVSSGAYNNSDLVRQYQLQCFELSKQALLANNENPSDMGTFTFSVSDDAFKAIAKEIQGLKARVRKIIAQDRKKATGVHQLNIHLFTNLKKVS
ncbi:TIGR02147 family protein [Fibrobacter sp. UWCM]|uniref:TIGR02147 family protein n=1 Tax=Fibrobacter sp. UWCM TaxID=1896208 RepID=UPI0009174288|nr:TIGR02147 family protein [Fibrobacter sp. UWCM]SHH48246.1 TIGR02147 family protein [Fibrobacter sp. UWCM]